MPTDVAIRALTSRGGQQHVEAKPPPPVYGSPTTPSLLQHFTWRVFAIRGDMQAHLRGVQHVSWDDGGGSNGPILTGSLTLTDLPYGLDTQLQLDEGDMLSLEINSGGGFSELWRMRVKSPDVTVKARQRTYQLANDLDLLLRSDDDWYFKAGPKTDHPNGWTCDQVVAHVCQRYGVSIGGIVKGTYRRKKSWSHRGFSPLRVMQDAMNVERQHTGLRTTVAWRNQQLWIEPLRRSPSLLGLGPTLLEAELQSHLPNGENTSGINEGFFASSVTMRGLRNEPAAKDKQGKVKQSLKKMEVKHVSPASRARFGFVHRIVWSSDAKTEADLNEEAFQYLAAVAKPLKTVTLTTPGSPTIRRGDAIKLALGDAGLRNQIVWVTEASHTLTPAEYTTSITVTFDDPYTNKIAELIQSRVSDTLVGAQKIANHRKPKKAKTRAPKDAQATGSALPADQRRVAGTWESRTGT